MMNVETTEEFDNWLNALRDEVAKAKIASRIDRVANGNPGDVKPVGEGISEMRIHHGAGYRVYYCQNGETLIIILCGGDKDSQAGDIARAKKLKTSL
ncbi:MAG: type II toxin-antitoxin system RelE/ParE family toxin [Xanthobacteraceae bacterium]|nr:type II toxin-antitoxin system RelE/ParE family toxin [Xanthobacteraceae bacterium]